MADRPIYPTQLTPKGWEAAKGTLAKAVIKADVKGSLDKASKCYWESIPWENLENWETESSKIVAAAAGKIALLKPLLATVEANAAQGIREIDKVPANKITMKQSRAYLEAMVAAAKKFATEIDNYAAAALAAAQKKQTVETNAEKNFDGWLTLHTAKAADLVKECVMRCKAGHAAFTAKQDPERTKLKNDQLKYADNYMAALAKIYTDGEAAFKATGKVEQLMMLKKYNAFKANQAGQLKTMQDAKADLAAK